MSPSELEEARKVQTALAIGLTLPGGCRTEQECEAYCENPNSMEECIIFGETAGFIPPDELAEARKVLEAIKKGITPPPCRGKTQCETYCRQPENMESCLTFAEAAGFIPPEELADAKKMLFAIRKGIKPPPCASKTACDDYCSREDNFTECLAFAEAAGFIAPEEVEMARKTGGKGPGGCQGREECEAFCHNPENQETCFNFGREHDLIPEEDLHRIEEGKQEILRTFEQAPPEVRTCLENAFGSGVIDGIRAGTVMPKEEMGEKIRACFEQFMPSPGEFGPPPGFEGQMPPEGFQPPEGFHPPEGFPEEYQQQYEEQFRQQYEQQYQQHEESYPIPEPTSLLNRLLAALRLVLINILR